MPYSWSLVRQRGTVCRRKSRRHHWHSDGALAGWKLKCFFTVTMHQLSHYNFYYKTVWNINSVTELNSTDLWFQEPLRLMTPQRWNATASHMVITVPLRLPGIALLHLCARAAQPPYQVWWWLCTAELMLLLQYYTQYDTIWYDTKICNTHNICYLAESDVRAVTSGTLQSYKVAE